MFEFRYDWKQPYRWRTNLRAKLPWLMNNWFPKGRDCEAAGGRHQWFNIDNENSGCYHCFVVREGHLWKRN